MIRSIGKYPYLFLILEFLVVYAAALTFHYVEGDDASTVAFHALGRNPVFELPYSPYHGMMDLVLNVFPPNESILRFVAIGLGSITAITFLILSLKLVQQWMPANTDKAFLLFIPLIPLIIPEFFFFGLLYTPSTMAMSIMLAGHLLLRNTFENRTLNWLPLIASALLFGFGVSFRWDVGVYGIVIFTDIAIFLFRDKRINLRNVLILGGWSVIAILSVLLFIYISGYSPSKIVEIMTWAKSYMGEKSFNPLKSGSVAISYLTPAFLLASLFGIIAMVKSKRYDLLILAVIGFLPKLYLGISLLPKGVIMAFPGFILLVAYGFYFIRNQSFAQFRIKNLNSDILQTLFFIALILPWVVGIKLKGSSLSWGPGFEKKFKYASIKASDSSDAISLSGLRPSLDGGLALPTPEGPRPLWGYGWVLLAGEWRHLIQESHQSRQEMITLARQKAIPVLQSNEYKLIVVNLLNDGFKEKNPTFTHELFKLRTFVKGEEEVDILICKKRTLFVPENMEKVMQLTGNREFACWFLDSSDISLLKKMYGDQVKVIGHSSAHLQMRESNADEENNE